MVIWQVGAGEKEKDLVPIMIRDSLMIIGPGDVGDLSGIDEQSLKKSVKKDAGMLKAFHDAQKGEIVVLRLGSVCFAVGAITGKYEWSKKYEKVYSYWNENLKYDPKEQFWDLQHTREVHWFVLKDNEAIHYFRRGIYCKKRFCQVNDAKLHEYLEKKRGYDGKNGEEILKDIGDRTESVNQYGFPIFINNHERS